MDTQIIKTNSNWNVRIPGGFVQNLTSGHKVRLSKVSFGFVVSVKKPRINWTKAFSPAGQKQEPDDLVNIHNKFDQVDWQW